MTLIQLCGYVVLLFPWLFHAILLSSLMLFWQYGECYELTALKQREPFTSYYECLIYLLFVPFIFYCYCLSAHQLKSKTIDGHTSAEAA